MTDLILFLWRGAFKSMHLIMDTCLTQNCQSTPAEHHDMYPAFLQASDIQIPTWDEQKTTVP